MVKYTQFFLSGYNIFKRIQSKENFYLEKLNLNSNLISLWNEANNHIPMVKFLDRAFTIQEGDLFFNIMNLPNFIIDTDQYFGEDLLKSLYDYSVDYNSFLSTL
jgi:hypothetical protein